MKANELRIKNWIIIDPICIWKNLKQYNVSHRTVGGVLKSLTI
jgi:hypothetical protein